MITRKEQEIINLLPKVCDGDTCRQVILMVDELSTLRDKIEKIDKGKKIMAEYITNKDMFTQIFGFEPDIYDEDGDIIPPPINCEQYSAKNCPLGKGDCTKCDDWWNAPYRKGVVMSEYITKKQALENFENAYQSSEDSQDFRYYFESFIRCLPKEDVIERSEYDKLKQQLDEEHEMGVKAANNLLDALGRLDFQKKENAELRSKIDKAIKEIEQTTNTYIGSLMHESTKETILKMLKEI